ncbi:agglutinin cell wall attachment protein [Brachybacterium vulturis]|uniref:agglutinin cell wall attachment protein n=1 Tax=Brachybacterium vulturis TaxID=2017484 RepID=UPI0012FD6AA6|nr:agglutinin cell wall attachment protein [Brachybacterium vulturis]
MSDESSVQVPAVIRQRDIINQISAGLPDRVEGEWLELEFTDRRLSMYAEEFVSVVFVDGSTGTALPARGTNGLAKELRKLMYQPESGTWFSATWVVTKNSDGSLDAKVFFNYDDEPNWDDDIHPGLYGIDLEDFPRTDENIPEWLSSLLSNAAKAENERRAKAEEGKK